MFVGRLDELQRLESALAQTCVDEPAHFMVTGERGIGKTSLLLHLNFIAKGQIPVDGSTFRFLVLNMDVDQSTTQTGLVRRIQTHLDNELGKSEHARTFLRDAWALIQRVRVMDSGIEAKKDMCCDEVTLDQFALSLASVAQRVCDKEPNSPFDARYDGVLLLIDEADNCSDVLHLGSFLKLLLERLQRQSCSRILIGLAGLPEVRQRLQTSHPSSLRIFEELHLGRLSDGEVGGVIDLCMKRANETNTTEQTSITDEARSLLCGLSEGYPHFIQQFGFSAFAHDSDNIIDRTDVKASAFGPRGSLDLIGDRYYRNDFYNKIQQDSYRQVLRIMADDLDSWVPRAKIASRFKGTPSTLNNAIKALRDRHIILSKEGEKGVYRLQHKGFALWIKLYADPHINTLLEAFVHPKPNTNQAPTTPPTVP
jgi:energy-coupling factor transporter ATP-binding protein EcfA2